MTDHQPIGTEQRPVTTQLTSKRIKLTILVGVLSLLAGIVMLMFGDDGTGALGALLVVLGLATFVVGKFLKWWKHS